MIEAMRRLCDLLCMVRGDRPLLHAKRIPRTLRANLSSPGFDEPLLASRKTSSDALDRIKSENGGLVLIRRMKMRPVMRSADRNEHSKHDSEESGDLWHDCGSACVKRAGVLRPGT